MDFDEAARIVEGVPVPHISAGQGRVLYQHIRENRPGNLLELGTARGGSAVFIAAALEANGAGHLTSVDSTRWQWLDPTPGSGWTRRPGRCWKRPGLAAGLRLISSFLLTPGF